MLIHLCNFSLLFLGETKQMAILLTLALKNLDEDIPGLCLIYDELANIFSPSNNGSSLVEYGFLMWICETVQTDFQNNFIVDECPSASKGFDLCYYDCINQAEENQNDEEAVLAVAVNVSAILTNPKIVSMFAQFSLLKNLIIRRYGCDLEPINALLGAALVVPKNFNKVEKLTAESPKVALNINVLVANWYRELINAFAASEHQMIRKKVLLRLIRLIEIESNVRYILIESKRRSKPLTCSFQKTGGGGNAKIGRKSCKRGKKVNVVKRKQMQNQREINSDTENADIQPSFEYGYGPCESYRQLNSDILKLLKENFSVVFPIPEDQKGKGLHLIELR